MKLELTRDGPMLITENDADKIYLEQTLRVRLGYSLGCPGPHPIRRVTAEGVMSDGTWTYLITIPGTHVSPRQEPLHCDYGIHDDSGHGGCSDRAHEESLAAIEKRTPV